MTNTKGTILDALRKELRRRTETARKAQGMYRAGGNKPLEHFYSGNATGLSALEQWLDQEIASASPDGLNSELPAVRSTAWLDARREAFTEGYDTGFAAGAGGSRVCDVHRAWDESEVRQHDVGASNRRVDKTLEFTKYSSAGAAGEFFASSDYRERVRAEKAELDHKIELLEKFISEGTGARFVTLPVDERSRMIAQRNAMIEYRNILRQRIAAFPQN